jgi:hypothetical protein
MNFDPGKLLFPKLPPDLQRRQMRTIYLTAAVCLMIGAAVIFLGKMAALRAH